MQTIGEKLRRRKGFGPGFDFLRIALAICVVAWHQSYIVAGTLPGSIDADRTWLIWFPGYAILVMFFALSGFLIAASGMRLSLGNFLINRGLRIVPALAVEVVLSAFILGPLLTQIPIRTYLADFHTYIYFTNIVGWVHYFLPGVFTQSPAPEVNSSLWTVPFEYTCYGVMACLIVLGLLKRPAVVLACAAVFVAIGVGLDLAGLSSPPTPSVVGVASPQQGLLGASLFLGRGSRLLVSFLLGVATYLYRDRLPYDRRLLAACLTVGALAAVLGPAPWMSLPLLNAIVCPALAYITAYAGVSDMPRLPLLSKGDYSYGIYLYGFPVQQAVHAAVPRSSAFLQFAVALVAISLLAAFSWHAIEKPILTLRRRFSFVARERLAPSDPRSGGPVFDGLRPEPSSGL